MASHTQGKRRLKSEQPEQSGGGVYALPPLAGTEGCGMASRISYVISPQGQIVFAHESADPLEHVQQTLEAVRRLHDKAGAGADAGPKLQ